MFETYTKVIVQAVSILVMLDDALVPSTAAAPKKTPFCLNPCYAGRCSSTSHLAHVIVHLSEVSILVMLDDALVLEKQRLY